MGKKSHTEKTTVAPPSWAVGPLTSGMNQVSGTVSGNAANLNNIESGLTGMLPGLQQQVAGTQQQLAPAFGYANDTLGGKYLNSNPYIDSIVNQGEQDAGNAVNAAFSRAGRTGSDNHATQLARGVAQAGDSIRNQDYQFERGQQATAAGMLPGLTSAQYAGYTPLLGATQLAGQLPYYGIQNLGELGQIVGGNGTTNATKPGGWLTDMMNAAAAAAGSAAAASDIRLKTKVEKLGEAPDGLGVYEWNWKSDPDGKRQRGVLAHEVEKLRPWAHVKGFVNGIYDGVNYAALGAM